MIKTTSKATTKTNTKPTSKPVTRNTTKVTATKRKETKPKAFVGAKYSIVKQGVKRSTVHNIMLMTSDQVNNVKDIDQPLRLIKYKVYTKESYDGEKRGTNINTYAILDGTNKDFTIFTRIINLFIKYHCTNDTGFKLDTFVTDFSKKLFDKHEEIKANKAK